MVSAICMHVYHLMLMKFLQRQRLVTAQLVTVQLGLPRVQSPLEDGFLLSRLCTWNSIRQECVSHGPVSISMECVGRAGAFLFVENEIAVKALNLCAALWHVLHNEKAFSVQGGLRGIHKYWPPDLLKESTHFQTKEASVSSTNSANYMDGPGSG